jgi:hypothetical protein
LQNDNEELLAALRAHDRGGTAARLHRLQNAFLVMGRGHAVELCTQLREAVHAGRGVEPRLGALQAELQATALMLRDRLAEATPCKQADATLRPA